MNTMELRNGNEAVHGGLLLVALASVATVMPLCPWPWHLLLPLLIYGGIILAVPSLRRTAPQLSLGRMSGAPLAVTAALSAVTVAVLAMFHALMAPDVTALAANVPASTFGYVILAGVCFSILNAALEEVVFRGIFWEVLAKEWNAVVALSATSILFGLGHFNGYPPGPLGAVLAGLYGVALGLLRWWTGGVGLVVACHICADATIFVILIS